MENIQKTKAPSEEIGAKTHIEKEKSKNGQEKKRKKEQRIQSSIKFGKKKKTQQKKREKERQLTKTN